MIAAEVATLSESIFPFIGIRILYSAAVNHLSVKPYFSVPTAIATDFCKLTSVYCVSVSGVAATIVILFSRSQVNNSSVVALATGTENTAPLLARMILGFDQSVIGSAAITALAPTASAVR